MCGLLVPPGKSITVSFRVRGFSLQHVHTGSAGVQGVGLFRNHLKSISRRLPQLRLHLLISIPANQMYRYPETIDIAT